MKEILKFVKFGNSVTVIVALFLSGILVDCPCVAVVAGLDKRSQKSCVFFVLMWQIFKSLL